MTEQSTAVQSASTQEPKSPVSSGGALAALAPQNIDDAFRLAKALSMAGDMVPQHFQGKPEATMAAIVRGMEIGLAPMQALANIAVINGRASLWGDALPALMQRSGHHIDVEIVGEGNEVKAVAKLTRGDTGMTITREFSMADAQKANLLGKKGPWQQYPKRMLAHRARSWAVRDGAADALMGMQIAEEVQDYQPMRDVTPAPAKGGFADRANAAAQITQQQPVPESEGERQAEPIAADTTTEAEVQQDSTESPSGEGFDLPDGFEPDPFHESYEAGRKSFTAEFPVESAEGLTGDARWQYIAGWHFAANETAKAEG